MLLLVRRLRSGISNGGIYRSLEKEDEKIKAMHKRAPVVRAANKSVDAGELGYRGLTQVCSGLLVDR